MNEALRVIAAPLGFSEGMDARPRFHANDQSLDVLNVVPRTVEIEDLRGCAVAPSLDVEGFHLYPHVSRVADLRDGAERERLHKHEIQELLQQVSGADLVCVGSAGILRFGERSSQSGMHNNSRPARLVHVDVSDATAAVFYGRTRPAQRAVRRSAQYNVWRVLTPPPQDVPLALCDARTVDRRDLIPADAVFDQNGAVNFTFEALVLRHNPAQRWVHYSSMHPAEVLVFKTHDTDAQAAHCVPHGAFDNPLCPPDVPPRVSLEMRGTAYWFE